MSDENLDQPNALPYVPTETVYICQAPSELAAPGGYAVAIELLEAEAQRLRSEFEQAAAQAASPCHLGSTYVEMGFKAEEFKAAAWLRERHNAGTQRPGIAEATNTTESDMPGSLE